MNDQSEKPKTGINISVSEEATTKIVNAVTDLFSPVTEGLGLVGDHIRIYRERSVERALKRAKQIAEDEQLKPEMPPPKFLVPYLEHVSVEDEDDEGLREKWARLLLNAGAKPDSFAFFARTLLSELSSEEAMLLDYIVTETKVLTFNSYDEYTKDMERKQDAAFDECEQIVLEMNAGRYSTNEARELWGKVNAGAFMIQSAFTSDVPGIGHREGKDVFVSNPEIARVYWSFQILEGRKIVDTRAVNKFRNAHDINLYMTMGYVTRLGFGVVRKLYKAG